MSESDYVTRINSHPGDIDAATWDALLAQHPEPSPFMRHAYLLALHSSHSACMQTGWQPQFVTLWRGTELHAACPLYLKNHSYGEYVFDWAWANAYAQHGLDYYPKALVAVPFTPVPGPRLLARDPQSRQALVRALLAHAQAENLSSLHLLLGQAEDMMACEAEGMMRRTGVQFHLQDLPQSGGFEAFLAGLKQEKRKKIRQERRKVADAGVGHRWLLGPDIGPGDWAFFYRCYERTYLEHGNRPYLQPAFFAQMASQMPAHWLMFIAEHEGRPIASSLIGLDPAHKIAYGRYWGALERVDCLHFETCYYQPMAWCMAHGYRRFEGGAQGEHKMARALLPVATASAHWLAHPSFADAVQRFLQREGQGMSNYLAELATHSPLRAPAAAPPSTNRATD